MDRWQRLADAVIARRLELDLTQAQAAERAGLGLATWGKIEKAAQPGYKPRTLPRVEVALEWKPGSIDRIFSGQRPQQLVLSDADELAELKTRVNGHERRLAALEENPAWIGQMERLEEELRRVRAESGPGSRSDRERRGSRRAAQ